MKQRTRDAVIFLALAPTGFPSGLASRALADVSTTALVTPLSRQAFTKNLLRIQPDWTEEEVLAAVGKPDFVGHFDFEPNHTVWFYGCEGPRKLPTLGSICFDSKRRVSRGMDGNIPPPSPDVISEPELRHALSLLDEAPEFNQTNPGALIRIVNELMPLGKTKIFAAIREYDRVLVGEVRPDRSLDWNQPDLPKSDLYELLYSASVQRRSFDTHLLLLMRVLFNISGRSAGNGDGSGPMPQMLIGFLFTSPPTNRRLSPRFPIVLTDDIPLFEYSGLGLAGRPESALDELPFFEHDARLRRFPLRPTDHPGEALAHLDASPQWLLGHRYQSGSPDGDEKETWYEASAADRESMRTYMKEQILELLAPLFPSVVKVVRRSPDGNGALDVKADVSQWDAIMADIATHPIRWNPKTSEYEHVGDPQAILVTQAPLRASRSKER